MTFSFVSKNRSRFRKTEKCKSKVHALKCMLRYCRSVTLPFNIIGTRNYWQSDVHMVQLHIKLIRLEVLKVFNGVMEMDRISIGKVWAFVIMTVMVLSAFGGISGFAEEQVITTDIKPNPITMAPLPEPTTRSVILSEDFSAPWVPCSTGHDAPPGWTVATSPNHTMEYVGPFWSHFDDAVTGFPTSNSTPFSAGIWWTNIEFQDEWLITPELDFTDYVNCELSFNAIYTMPSYGAGADEHNYIKVSTDGGMSWDILGCLTHDPEFEIPGATGGPGGAGWCWYEMWLPGQTALPIDLSAYDGEPSIQIAWNVDFPGNGPRGIHCVDDVHVDGTYVPPPEVDHIEVVPNTLMITVGDTQQFIATAYDMFNNTIPGAMIFWSTDVGVVNSTGQFTAQTTPGIGIVTATSGSASDSADVTVVLGAYDHIIVTPDPAFVTVGGTQQFTATAYDVYSNVIPGMWFSWTTDIGSIDAAGFFTAQTTPAVGTVMATNGTISGSADVTISETFSIDITTAIGSNDWILMSFPNQISGDPLFVIQDALDEGGGYVTWDVAQTYNASLGGWLTTSANWPISLNKFNYVDNKMAFWIHITDYGDGNMTFAGPLAMSGEQAVIPLKAGWNLVGCPFGNSQPMTDTFGNLVSLDRPVESYDFMGPYRLGIIDVGTAWHNPGTGYWVHVAFDEDLWMWNP